VTSIEGEAIELQLSPTSDGLLVKSRVAPDSPLTEVIVNAHGVTRDLDKGWHSLGWAGRDRLLLMRQEEEEGSDPARLSVLNVETGAKLDVYP
jgi:hypothetical protein